MPFIGILIAPVLLIVGLVALFAWEDHDKRKRAEDGLPPKKYGDITDHDVTTVYAVRYKKD